MGTIIQWKLISGHSFHLYILDCGLLEMFGLETRVEGWLEEFHTGVYLLTFMAAILMSLPLVFMDINTDRGFRSRAHQVSQLERTQSMKYIINL